MGKFFDSIPDSLVDWIEKQELFFVSTAPLTGDGHVNVSPKGLKGTFHLVSPTKVWYEDMTGSGSETIAHVKENGRITIMFSAFNGAPRIVRLFGTGVVHEWGEPELDAYIPPADRKPGLRSIIVVDVHKVGTSCGYGVPYYSFQKHRTLNYDMAHMLEVRDIAAEEAGTTAERGLKGYWRAHSHSIDGLPSVEACFATDRKALHVYPVDQGAPVVAEKRGAAEERVPEVRIAVTGRDGLVLVAGFAAGLAVALASRKILASLA